MAGETLSATLEDEHRSIDAGLAAFAAAADGGQGGQSLAEAIEALRRHIYAEEVLLFPALREAELVAPVFVMLREHGEIWRDLDTLEREVAAGGVGQSQLEVYRRLAERLQSHNVKEEQILYPQADARLSAEQQDALAAFLEAGRMPDGWVCAQG